MTRIVSTSRGGESTTWVVESRLMAYRSTESAGLPADVRLVTELSIGGGVKHWTFSVPGAR